MIEKIYICNIIIKELNDQALFDTEIIIIHAESLQEALGHLIVYKNYSDTLIVNLKEDRLLAQVKDLNTTKYALISLPSEILSKE